MKCRINEKVFKIIQNKKQKIIFLKKKYSIKHLRITWTLGGWSINFFYYIFYLLC